MLVTVSLVLFFQCCGTAILVVQKEREPEFENLVVEMVGVKKKPALFFPAKKYYTTISFFGENFRKLFVHFSQSI